MKIDASELVDLGRDLADVGVAREVRQVMSKAGVEMKKRARAEAPTGHLPGYARTINYEVLDGGMAVELRPDESGQGLLSAVAEFGQGANAARPHILPQADREAPVAERHIADVLARRIARGR